MVALVLLDGFLFRVESHLIPFLSAYLLGLIFVMSFPIRHYVEFSGVCTLSWGIQPGTLRNCLLEIGSKELYLMYKYDIQFSKVVVNPLDQQCTYTSPDY
jgi:hypothetical protein